MSAKKKTNKRVVIVEDDGKKLNFHSPSGFEIDVEYITDILTVICEGVEIHIPQKLKSRFRKELLKNFGKKYGED